MPGAVVTGVDVNERAVLLANENAAALGRRRPVHRATPDAVPADATYDEIWSNPPIRIGKEALHELLLTWLPRLAPGGRAVMVVGKNLGADSLQRWLGEQGYPTSGWPAPRASGCWRPAGRRPSARAESPRPGARSRPGARPSDAGREARHEPARRLTYRRFATTGGRAG